MDEVEYAGPLEPVRRCIDMTTDVLISLGKNTAPIESLYVYLSIDADGNEGVCAVLGGVGPMQAVTSKMAIAATIEPKIIEMAKLTNHRIRLVKFTTKDILKTYEP